MEELISLVAVVGGLGLTAFIFGSIFNLIRAKINKNNFDEEAFNRLAKAFMKHKKESERRIQNLEAIIAGDETETTLGSKDRSSHIEAPTNNIEIEDTGGQESGTGSSNLRNMLRE